MIRILAAALAVVLLGLILTVVAKNQTISQIQAEKE